MNDQSKQNQPNRHRRSIRLKGYDYSQDGLYFITICVQDRYLLFGEVIDGQMQLNNAGKIAEQCWLAIPNHFPTVVVHEYVFMPNHLHGIIEIVGAHNYSPDHLPNHSPVHSPENEPTIAGAYENIIGDDIVGANNYLTGNNIDGDFRAKDFSPQQVPSLPSFRSPSKTIGSIVRGFKIGVSKGMGFPVWQRNYYEHIIRNEQSYQTISNYIINNPAKWKADKFHKS